jgi:hypothetical protein
VARCVRIGDFSFEIPEGGTVALLWSIASGRGLSDEQSDGSSQGAGAAKADADGYDTRITHKRSRSHRFRIKGVGLLELFCSVGESARGSDGSREPGA